MELFKEKKIHLDSETISERLRLARQSAGIKIEKAAKELKINVKYLDALEKGRFELLPPGVYGKNFLREYAHYLRLDYRVLLGLYEKEFENTPLQIKDDYFDKQVVKSHYFLSLPKIIRGLSIACLVLIVLVYLGFRLQKIIAPPSLVIDYPVENFITQSADVELRGRIEPESQLIINGEQVLSDSFGNFSKIIALKKGVNTVIVTAQKKYGRTTDIARQILRQE